MFMECKHAQAMEWWSKSAALGNDCSMSSIGDLYRDGLGVERDVNKAMEWYSKAAELGNSLALTKMGELYLGKI